MALESALKYIKKQTHPSSTDLLNLAEHCNERGNYLRASFFQMTSAYKKSEEAAEPHDKCFFTSERIYNTKDLVHKLKVTLPDEAMKRGKPMQIARFVTSFLVKMYDVGCAKDQSYVASESRKGFALLWIAVAYQDVTEHKKSKRYAEKGKREIEENMAENEREKLQTYVRLLKALGHACLRVKDYPNALEHCNDALNLIDGAEYQSEEQRQKDKEYILQTKSAAEIKNRGRQ